MHCEGHRRPCGCTFLHGTGKGFLHGTREMQPGCARTSCSRRRSSASLSSREAPPGPTPPLAAAVAVECCEAGPGSSAAEGSCCCASYSSTMPSGKAPCAQQWLIGTSEATRGTACMCKIRAAVGICQGDLRTGEDKMRAAVGICQSDLRTGEVKTRAAVGICQGDLRTRDDTGGGVLARAPTWVLPSSRL
jgi:hypothetical protein